MRIYVTGNEDTARYHLPVVQSRAMDFAERCKRAGLSQDAMSFSFDDTGTHVSIQYVFGQLQVQIASPVIDSVPIASAEEEQKVFMPGTFYMETSLGYFWVRVRKDDDGISRVELEPFEAMKSSDDMSSQEFVYPAMGHRTPGMLSGSFGSDGNRYVVSQAGGVFVGKDQQKGTIKMPPTGNGDARLNVQQNDAGKGAFCIMDNTEGKSCFFKYIIVSLDDNSEISVEMKHGSVDMLSEGESGGIVPDNLEKIPCWIHRKCSGSYFSPNKTIGYHVDVGSDDEYFGNAWAIPSGIQDKLDNGQDERSFFNHAKELYRIAPLFASPISVSDTSISLILLSPTMQWVPTDQDAFCWGGYGMTSTTFGCIDQQKDFGAIFSPRFCVVNYNFISGSIDSISEASAGEEVLINSWCNSFYASANISNETSCGPKYGASDFSTKNAAPQCGWTEVGTSSCSLGSGQNVPILAEIPKARNYYQHAAFGFEENIEVKRKVEFRFNGQSFISNVGSRANNFYFLFDGLWHESMAGMWASSLSTSNQCGICAYPPVEQSPGGTVVFFVNGSSVGENGIQWLAENATEYVDNLQIISPLAVQPVDTPVGSSSALCFVAKVPEKFAAPSGPVLLTGGISYPSPDVEGETVKCEYSLVSTPCICDSSFSFDTNPSQSGSYINTSGGMLAVKNGCAPYNWSIVGGTFYDEDGNYGSSVIATSKTFMNVEADGVSCSISASVIDACGNTAEIEYTDSGGSSIASGPTFLEQGASAEFTHGLGEDAIYSGGMTLVSSHDSVSVLKMPEDATTPKTATWTGRCNHTSSISVTPGFCDCESVDQIYFSVDSYINASGGYLAVIGGCGPLTWAATGGSFIVNGANVGQSITDGSVYVVEFAVDSPYCRASVTVTDSECGDSIEKAFEVSGGGYINGPDVLQWGASASFYHNINGAVYSGGLNVISSGPGVIVLEMPEFSYSSKTFSLHGGCEMSAEKTVYPNFCNCSETVFEWSGSSGGISLGQTSYLQTVGGCQPFQWFGDNIEFVDGDGNTIAAGELKISSGVYARSTDECSGSVTVRDACNRSLSKESHIDSDGTVVGPDHLAPGEYGTYYHDIGDDAVYTGTLEVAHAFQGGAMLIRPSGDESETYTASWSASCGRIASKTVLALECEDLPRSGCGEMSTGDFYKGPGYACYKVGDVYSGYPYGGYCYNLDLYNSCGGTFWTSTTWNYQPLVFSCTGLYEWQGTIYAGVPV